MGNDQLVALIETDQAAIAAAEMALQDLQRIGVVLCYQRWTVELGERYQENLQIVSTGLGVVRRWGTELRLAARQ